MTSFVTHRTVRTGIVKERRRDIAGVFSTQAGGGAGGGSPAAAWDPLGSGVTRSHSPGKDSSQHSCVLQSDSRAFWLKMLSGPAAFRFLVVLSAVAVGLTLGFNPALETRNGTVRVLVEKGTAIEVAYWSKDSGTVESTTTLVTAGRLSSGDTCLRAAGFGGCPRRLRYTDELLSTI